MNKLLLSKNGRNHIRIMPVKGALVAPEDPGDKIRFSEEVFKTLQNSSEVIRHSYYCNRKKGLLTGVWELDGKIYLDHCFHTADKGVYVTTIYVFDKSYLNDALAIEKFLRENMDQIGKDYKAQIIEGKAAWDEAQGNDTRDEASKPD